MTSLLSLLLLLMAGLPLVFALTRAVPLAIVVAPIAGAATATVAVLLMLAFRGPLLMWFVPVYLLTVVLAWRLRGQPRAPHGSWRDALLLTVPLAPPFLPVFQQPIIWDTHLIWWLHSGYFSQGGAFARYSMGNAVLEFSHPDYPPLASAPVALVWQLLDIRDFFPAATVTGALTFSAIAAVVYAVRVVTAAGPALVSWLAAIAVGYSAWSPFWWVPTAGLSDAMCAAAFAAGAVLLLFGAAPFDRRTLPVTMLLLCSAAMTKNEGLTMVAALALVGTVRHRRFPLVFSMMAGRVGPIAVLALAAALLGLGFLRGRRRELGIGGDLWLWAVVALYWAGLTLIYVVTPFDLLWHLGTSVDRVMISIAVLSCASAAAWGVVALTSAADDSNPLSG